MPRQKAIYTLRNVNRQLSRFDNLESGTVLVFPKPEQTIVAYDPEGVAPATADVDKATRTGSWAYGYVAKDAAPGLDPGLSSAAPRGVV